MSASTRAVNTNNAPAVASSSRSPTDSSQPAHDDVSDDDDDLELQHNELLAEDPLQETSLLGKEYDSLSGLLEDARD